MRAIMQTANFCCWRKRVEIVPKRADRIGAASIKNVTIGSMPASPVSSLLIRTDNVVVERPTA